MKKILLTGADGFVGRHVREYLKDDYELVYPTENLLAPIDLPPVDYIINLATRLGVEDSIKDPVGFISNNLGLMLNVLEYARKHHIKLIHFSTTEANSPSNPYAGSKAAQESLCQAYAVTYGFDIAIASSHNIIGEGGGGKFIPLLLERLKKDELVSVYEGGSRTYNPVQNVCSGLKFMLANFRSGKFLINGGENMTNLEMAQLVADLLGKHLNYEVVDASATRPGYSSTLKDGGTPLTTLGWQPTQTVREALAWIQKV